ERTERHEADTKLFKRRQNLSFWFAPPQRVLTLECRYGLDGVCAANRLSPGFRETEVLHLAFTNQVAHGTRDVFDRHVRIDAMLIEEVDPVGLEPFQRSLRDVADVRRTAVETGLLAALELEAELRRDDHLVTQWRESFADELLVSERPVGFRRVEERHAALEGGSDDRDAVFTAGSGAVPEAEAHAAEAKGRYVES